MPTQSWAFPTLDGLPLNVVRLLHRGRPSGMLPFVGATELDLSLLFEKLLRAFEHQTTRERLLIRTAAEAEHQQGPVALDPRRVKHVTRRLGLLHETDVMQGRERGHLQARPFRPPHRPVTTDNGSAHSVEEIYLGAYTPGYGPVKGLDSPQCRRLKQLEVARFFRDGWLNSFCRPSLTQ